MILSAQTIRKYRDIVTPFCERDVFLGMSFGLSAAGYDIRIAETLTLYGGEFHLVSSFERFKMPTNIIAFVHDKSSWARKGLAVQNTVIEPGWEGYLTLELTNHHPTRSILLTSGMPIAQIVFQLLDEPTERPYNGKYQNQEAGPQEARYEPPRR